MVFTRNYRAGTAAGSVAHGRSLAIVICHLLKAPQSDPEDCRVTAFEQELTEVTEVSPFPISVTSVCSC